jgi:hypothetical protein
MTVVILYFVAAAVSYFSGVSFLYNIFVGPLLSYPIAFALGLALVFSFAAFVRLKILSKFDTAALVLMALSTFALIAGCMYYFAMRLGDSLPAMLIAIAPLAVFAILFCRFLFFGWNILRTIGKLPA